MNEFESLLRPNIRKLVPYSSARDEYKGNEGIFLDANENPFENGFNRYPDPYQHQLKDRIAQIKKVHADQLLLGNGSDECIDILYRAFCRPGRDNVILLPPTYGMYKVAAEINDVETREVSLDENFLPVLDKILPVADANTKLIFVCSPNNPSGNVIPEKFIVDLYNNFSGIIVIDEAYVDFCPQFSFVGKADRFPRIIVLQTLSKAWGLAGLRLGILIAASGWITVFNKIKPPYNIGVRTQELVLEKLSDKEQHTDQVKAITVQRDRLRNELLQLGIVEKVYPSEANFLLVKFSQANEIFEFLIRNMVIVRNRSSVRGCENSLRITVGTKEENDQLIKLLHDYQVKTSK